MSSSYLDAQSFLRIVDQTPLVSMDLILEDNSGHILLGQRKNPPAQNDYFVPGGRILKNETLESAFKRLCAHELGLSLDWSQAHLLGVYEHMYHDNFLKAEGVSTHYVVMAYRIVLEDTAQPDLQAQHHRFDWWSVGALLTSDQVHANTKAYFDI